MDILNIDRKETERLIERFSTRAKAVFLGRVGFILLSLIVGVFPIAAQNSLYFFWTPLALTYAFAALYYCEHTKYGRWIYFLTLCLDLFWLTFLILQTGGLLSPLMACIPIFTLFFVILFHNPLVILPPLLLLPAITFLEDHSLIAASDILLLLILYSFLNGIIVYLISYALSKEESQSRQIASLQMKLKKMAVVEERNRLARELHDGVGGMISGMIIQSEFLLSLSKGHTELTTEIKELKAAAEESVDEIRRALAMMKNNFDFELQLKNMEQIYKTRYKMPLTIDIISKIPKFSDHANLTIFRILQECLTNANKHAKATKVCLTADFENPSHFRFIIKDDGVGFNSEKNFDGHYGLINIVERAKSIGGKLEISSTPKRGCEIILLLSDKVVI